MSGRIAVEVLVRGRVQGVNYRGWTQDQARRRGLAGWVRNNPDGTVTALFVGARSPVDDMIEACRAGPLAAWVDGLETTPVAPPDERTDFRILR